MKLFTNELNCNPIRIPAEWEPHSCCWMAWAIHPEWLGWLDQVKSELGQVIYTIAEFETVRLLAPTHELADAKARFAGGNVEIIEAPVDDIWMRDIAPTFGSQGDEVVAVDWNFNGWGSTKARPTRPGDQLAKIAEGVFGVRRISVPFVADAGALITDGCGTLITSRSCLLNPNRNQINVTEQFLEREFSKLGIHRTIWLKGDSYEPVTSGHVDGYVMFNAPGAVLVETFDDEQVTPPMWRAHDMMILENMSDSTEQWRFRGEMFAPCYLNAYVANQVVITARFGDIERDEAAQEALEMAFPGREVIMLNIDYIAAGGGGIHCLTQPMLEI